MKHGLKHHPLYSVWSSMKKRCDNPNEKAYKHYGGRGIEVCKEWYEFKKFYDDMVVGYKQGLQLDRIDNDKGYSKKNCRWATVSQNCSNRRTSIVFGGLCAKEQSLRHGASAALVKRRIKRGWSKKDAFSKPKIEPITYKGETASNASFRLGGKMNLVRVRIQKLSWSKRKAFTTSAKIK